MSAEPVQYYFKCSSCRWFGPLTNDELASMRVNELGSSSCPRCGQAGYLDPGLPARASGYTTWLVMVAVAVIATLAAVFTL